MNAPRAFPAFSMLFAIWFFSFAQVPAATNMKLTVDASNSPGNILHARETIPVKPGKVGLRYPEWIPGEHGPTGPVVDIAGLQIEGGGKTLRWRRDPTDMFLIGCEIPEGISQLDVAFDFLLPPNTKGFSSGGSSTPGILVLSWNHVVLFPAQERPADITVDPSLKVHEGWDIGTALEIEHRDANLIHFKSVTLNKLIDSPVSCGLHVKKIDISADPAVPHFLDLVSDDEAAIQMSPALMEKHRQLVIQANMLFGAHHYYHYDFLYTLSDHTAHFGLEHHQSSDDRVEEGTLTDSTKYLVHAGLLPHEFVHSWNGKYRRPAGLATGDYTTPMKDDLLWVYEGLTEYLGNVLTARSGLRTQEQYCEFLALVAAGMDSRVGRSWRPLQDAADEASVLYGSREDWRAYRRSVDFYDEGDLIWLEADVTIRRETSGKKSLDDFCKLFYGAPSTGPELKPYTFEDLIAALGQTAQYDWLTFFTTRLESLSPRAPLGGIEGGGWKLIYRDTRSAVQEAVEEVRKVVDMSVSLGIQIEEEGSIGDVIPGTPAAKAGVAPKMKLIAVNGRGYTPRILRDAVRAAMKDSSPIRLLTELGEYYTTFNVDYHGGERYPWLERDTSKADILSQIIRPVAKK